MPNHVLGLQLYTVRDFMADAAQLRETLDKVANIGYAGVQGGPPKFMAVEDFRKELDARGLVASVAGQSVREILADEKPTVAQCRAMGVTDVYADSIWGEYQATREGYVTYAKILNDAGAKLAPYGIRLQYHAHAFEFCSYGGENGMDVLFAETDPKFVYFMLDTHWLQSGGVNPGAWIRRCKGRISQVHLKDYGIAYGAKILEDVPRRFAEVGEGNLDFVDIVAACREVGVVHYVVEQDFCTRDPFESARISYEALKKLGL